MQRDERLAILRGLPKVDLHRHLEGSMRLSTLLEFGRKRGLDLPLSDEETLAKAICYNDGEPRSLAHFLSKFRSDWYSTYADVERVCREAVKDAASEGVIVLELRFSPEHFTRNTRLRFEGVMEAVCEAGQAAAEDHGLALGFLVTLVRERRDDKIWAKLVNRAAELSELWVVGVDLAGDEVAHPNENFVSIFDRVVDTGVLHATIHAGEGTQAAHVRSAVELLHAERIGHGISAAEDPAVMGFLAEKGVCLEVCPISNYQTGCVDDLQEHPLLILDQAGVRVCLNSDDPTLHRTRITNDYDVAVSRWGYGLDDLLRLELTAAEQSFLPEEDRVVWAERIEREYRISGGQGLS